MAAHFSCTVLYLEMRTKLVLLMAISIELVGVCCNFWA